VFTARTSSAPLNSITALAHDAKIKI